MVAGVDAAEFLAAELDSEQLAFAENVEVGLVDVGDEVAESVNTNDVPENLPLGGFHQAGNQFAVIIQWLAQGGDGDTAGKPGGGLCQDIPLREGGADGIDRVELNKVLVWLVGDQSEQSIVDPHKIMILQLDGEVGAFGFTRRMNGHEMDAAFREIAKY